MLDFSLGELMMIGVVALVVLGPERLPRVARAFGEMLGKAQRYVSQVRADFQREFELAELKRLQEEARKAAQSIDSSVREAAATLDQAAQAVSGEVASAGEPPAPSAPMWSSGGWGSHRFRMRTRPGPSLDELTEAVEQLRGEIGLPAAGRLSKNRHAPRSRVNRPRIHR
jgi:sec-independent protein translocase protein TatB